MFARPSAAASSDNLGTLTLGSGQSTITTGYTAAVFPGATSKLTVANLVRTLAGATGVADRLTLVGGVRRQELPAWYRSADVLACPAWYEPFGLTPLEAMACGVPVVAYAVGGFTDTVVDGVTGHLVSARDHRALASTLRKLLHEPSRLMAYGTAAVDRARSCYSWRRTAEQLGRLYGAVTGREALLSEAVA